MIDRIVGLCLRRRGLALIVALATLVFGWYSWTQLQVIAYPSISDVTAQVITQAPGLAAEEIEQQITTPLERMLASTPRLATMRSSSTFGLSLITMVFRDGAEDYWIRQRINERVQQVTLPTGITPALDPLTGPDGEIYCYVLESDSKNLMELSEIQRWVVIPALQQVPGVVNVDNFGGFTRQFQVELDPAELQRFGLGLSDVVAAINSNSSNAGGGRIARGEQAYVIRGIGLVRTLDDLGNIVVTQRNGVPILVRDLGSLAFSHQEREGIVGKDENPDTVEGIVDLLINENPSEVLAAIHAKVAELNRDLAPQDVRIAPFIDRAELVQASVHKVSVTVLQGVGLVCLVLLLFLGSPRGALVVAATIPLALAVCFGLMNATQLPANLLSLGAIDFGVIVDGAVVVLEAILRRREARPNEALTEADVRVATGQVAKPIFFATLIIITAYLPLFALQRAEARLFTPIAYTMGYSLLGALACTIALTPGLAFLVFRAPHRAIRNRPLEALTALYRRALAWLLDRPAIGVAIMTAAMAGVIGLGVTSGREFLPDLDEGALWLQARLPTGISLEKASEMAGELRRTLRSFPEVSYAVTQVGRSDDQTDPWTPSHLEVPVGLTPYVTWPAGENKQDFLHRLDARLKALPGFDIGISQPIIDSVNDVVGGAHSALVLRVFGEDFNELRRIGNAIVKLLDEEVEGTAEASIFQEPPLPQITVTVDRAAAARYGINVADVTALIQTGVGGTPVTQVFVGDRTYDVSVRFPAAWRNSPEALGKLVLSTAGGAQIPLSEVARIGLQNGESTIAHEMNHRNITIRMELRDRDLSSYLAEAKQRIAGEVQFDTARYRLEWGGQYDNLERAQKRITLVLVLGLGLMLLFLYAQFQTLRHAVLVLGLVPLAALGGLIALRLTGSTLNCATAVGFVALFGVAVQNGIIMVANLNRWRALGGPLRQAVLAGATERFRPVLITATVASIGMLPAALATGVGSDVQRGLGTVVVGGLAVGTFMTLLTLPALYVGIEQIRERWLASAQPASEAGE
jgi:cobalt-zinc-cadmium resistance protein CzcA